MTGQTYKIIRIEFDKIKDWMRGFEMGENGWMGIKLVNQTT